MLVTFDPEGIGWLVFFVSIKLTKRHLLITYSVTFGQELLLIFIVQFFSQFLECLREINITPPIHVGFGCLLAEFDPIALLDKHLILV